MEQSLSEQNTHWNGTRYQQHFLRLHDKRAADDLDFDEIQVVTGIRRCGKSTLLHHLINTLMQTNPPKSILYVNFDDPNYTEICQNPLKS